MSIDLTKFKISQLYSDSNVLIIGSRLTGKTVLVKDIMYHKKDMQSGVVFNPSESSNPVYGQLVPEQNVLQEYDEQVMRKIFDNQREIRKKEGKTSKNNFFVALDDLHGTDICKTNTFRELYINNRCYNIFSVTATQNLDGMYPVLRANVDWVFLFNVENEDNRKKLYHTYGSMISTYQEFCKILDSCTNYECIVIKNTGGGSPKLQDCVFWYKAELHEPFKVGFTNDLNKSPQSWWNYLTSYFK